MCLESEPRGPVVGLRQQEQWAGVVVPTSQQGSGDSFDTAPSFFFPGVTHLPLSFKKILFLFI